LEDVVLGADNDELGQSSLCIDDEGTLHLVFDRISGGDHDYYATQKPIGGDWATPVPVGDQTHVLSDYYLAVQKTTGTACVVYLDRGLIKLAVGTDLNWEYYDLQTPYLEQLFDPAVAVDNDGNAHVAFIIYNGGVYKIGYGYWDGTTDFHFQMLDGSQLGGFGSGASPDIAVRSDGSVAIMYRGNNYPAYEIHVAENSTLGGTDWSYSAIAPPGYACYPGAIKTTPNDDLHMAFNGNMGFGFPNDIFYSIKPAGSASWTTETDIGGTLGGADVKLAVEDDGSAHVVCMETSGNFYTGNLVYCSNLTGSWTSEILLTTEKYNPSIVIDQQGNGSLSFMEYVGSQNHDVYYYGYVAPPVTPNIAVTLTPYSIPIVIPTGGGTFEFNLALTSNMVLPVAFEVWTDVVLPNGTPSEILGPVQTTLEPAQTRNRDVIQAVPGRAPAGDYWYRVFVGTYQSVVVDADSFSFNKSGSNGGIFTREGWVVTENEPVVLPATTKLVSTYPNPFNPTTSISIQLSAFSQVNLAVYDVQGRLVETLIDSYQSAGTHDVIFDASSLSSGIYLVRLEAGNLVDNQKIVLMK